jgi:DNA helicase HerA-like ATPase
MSSPLLIAKGKSEFCLIPRMLTRHGLVAGATGTGKTVTLQTIAENLSANGIPVFVADVKGDLAGLSQAGGGNLKIQERVNLLKLSDFTYQKYPAAFWDVFGKSGHPVRATVSDMGPLLLGRLLSLNEVQTGVLTLVFKIADDSGLLLLDLKDLRSMIQFIGDNASEFTTSYGNVSKASVGTIQRGLLELDAQGAEEFFGEPMLDILDLIQVDTDGRGVINVLAADQLILKPKVYSTFLLWLMSELFEQLPEAGDLEKPKFVFFFDEAHFLFEDASPALLDKIEQVVRLIRSKGVGIYFVTQNPTDIPDKVLAQLGNRVQHALRAFTPKDQKDIRAMAATYRANSKLDIEKVMTELAVGEALVSFLDDKGIPAVVDRGFVLPPHSRIGTIMPDERGALIRGSVHFGHYEQVIDRESAYEVIKKRVEERAAQAQAQADAMDIRIPRAPESYGQPRAPREPRQPREPKSQTKDMFGALAHSAAHAMGSQLGRQIMRGVLGSILGGRR